MASKSLSTRRPGRLAEPNFGHPKFVGHTPESLRRLVSEKGSVKAEDPKRVVGVAGTAAGLLDAAWRLIPREEVDSSRHSDWQKIRSEKSGAERLLQGLQGRTADSIIKREMAKATPLRGIDLGSEGILLTGGVVKFPELVKGLLARGEKVRIKLLHVDEL